LKKPITKKAGGVAQDVGPEFLSSNSSTVKKEREREKERDDLGTTYP
jgi:hypothetical protein